MVTEISTNTLLNPGHCGPNLSNIATPQILPPLKYRKISILQFLKYCILSKTLSFPIQILKLLRAAPTSLFKLLLRSKKSGQPKFFIRDVIQVLQNSVLCQSSPSGPGVLYTVYKILDVSEMRDIAEILHPGLSVLQGLRHLLAR